MSSSRLRALVSEWWLVLRASAWLCRLPWYIRSSSLPRLLERLQTKQRSILGISQIEADRASALAIKLSDARIFRSSLFPKRCVRQTLALAYAFSLMGQAFKVHFGVRKEGQGLYGHCWVTVREHPVGERAPAQWFTVVYSYAFDPSRVPSSSSGD
jgi:hypothetical protein